VIEDLEPFARDVLAALSKSTSESNFSTALDMARPSAVKGCLKLLEDLSLDGATFYGRYSITHADVVQRLRELTSEDEGVALSAWTAVLFVFAHSIEVSSTLGRDGSVPTVADLKLLRSVARRSLEFHSLIVEFYDLPDRPAQDHANTIRWEKLELHRLGTRPCLISA